MGFIIKREDKQWPGGVFPFQFDDRLEAAPEANARAAMAILAQETFWQFREVDETEDRVVFRPVEALWRPQDYPNSSAYGDSDFCLFDPNRQFINLEQTTSVGRCMHEILHAMGVKHEHQRPDRDDFVEIRRDRMRAFSRSPIGIAVNRLSGITVGPYDYGSIMHYGLRGRARALPYTFDAELPNGALYTTTTDRTLGVFFHPETRAFERHVRGRFPGFAEFVASGRFARRCTDILHYNNGARLFEIRFNRNSGRQVIVAIDEDGVETGGAIDDRSLGGGPWAAPALQVSNAGVAIVHFNRRRSRLKMVALDPTGAWVTDLNAANVAMAGTDASRVILAPVGVNGQRVILFNGEGDRSAVQHTLLPMDIGEVTGNNVWPGRWREAMLWRSTTAPPVDYVMGYERRGRVVRYDLGDDGALSNAFVQTELPRDLEYAGLGTIDGTLSLHTVNATGGARRRCRTWALNTDDMTITSEREWEQPTIIPLDDAAPVTGQRDAMTRLDIRAANLLMNRDLHVVAIDEDAFETSERTCVARLWHDFTRALPLARRWLVLGRPGDTTVNVHAVGRTGNVTLPTDPASQEGRFDLGFAWRDLAALETGGGAMLYVLGMAGNVRRARVDGRVEAAARDEFAGDARFTFMTALRGNDGDYLILYDPNNGGGMLHAINPNRTVEASGIALDLPAGRSRPVAYATGTTDRIVMVGGRGLPAFYQLDTTSGNVARDSVPRMGRGWTAVAAHAASQRIVFYQGRNGRTDVWTLDGTGLVSSQVSRATDREWIADNVLFDARDGVRYLTLRAPSFWTMNDNLDDLV